MMDGQGTHLSCLGDLEYLDHLECLGGKIGGKVLKMIKVLNILMAGDLSILPISKRSARKNIAPVWRAPRLM